MLALVTACGGASAAGAGATTGRSAEGRSAAEVRTEPDTPDVAHDQLVGRQLDRYAIDAGAPAGRDAHTPQRLQPPK